MPVLHVPRLDPGWNVELMLNPGRGVDEHGMLNTSGHAELLIVDEADRLKVAALEQLRVRGPAPSGQRNH